MLTLVTHLDRQLFEPSVFLYQSGGPLQQAIEATGTPVSLYPVRVETEHAGWIWDQQELARLVGALWGQDIAFTFYGGRMGNDTTPLGVEAARMANIPIQIQHIAWMIPAVPHLPLDALEVPSAAVREVQRRYGVKYPVTLIEPRVFLFP